MTEYKQAIVLREDLEISKGKMISQACHACLKSYQNAEESIASAWQEGGAKKVALKSDNLERLSQTADSQGVANALVKDAGHTEVEPGTVTAFGVGPAEEAAVDAVTGGLGLID